MWVRASDDDRGRHGGREQHRLAGLGRHRQEPLDVGQEAEVEHLVGLVEDQRVHVGEVERAAVGQVDEPAGRADDDVDAGLERVELAVVADAAVDGEHAQAAVLAGQVEVAGDLERELAGRGDDQRLRLALRHLGVVGSLGATLRCSTGMPKARVLPVPVRAWPIRSVPMQGDREGHLLDGEGGGDAGALERVADLGEDPELSERGQCLVAFVSSAGPAEAESVRPTRRRNPRACLPRTFGRTRAGPRIGGARAALIAPSLSVGCAHD